jgi:putative regulator of septum formation
VDERPLDAGPYEPAAALYGQAAAGYQPPPPWGQPQNQPTWETRTDQPTWGPAPYQPGWEQPQSQAAWEQQPSQPAWGQQPYQPAWRQYPPVTASTGGYPSMSNYSSYQRPSLDGCSVAALIFGILPTVPLGAIFGIAGFVRTRGGLRRGRPMAVIGMMLSALWVVLFALIGAAAQHESSRSGTIQLNPGGNLPSRVATGAVSPLDLRAGDCFMIQFGVAVNSIPLIPCGQLHDAQIFANAHIPGVSYPGSEAKTLDAAMKVCEPAARSYVNGRLDLLRVAAFYPSSDIWAMGDHTAHCVLYDPRQSFVGDVRDHH